MHHNTTDKRLLIRYVDLLENPVNRVTFHIKEISLLMFSNLKHKWMFRSSNYVVPVLNQSLVLLFLIMIQAKLVYLFQFQV